MIKYNQTSDLFSYFKLAIDKNLSYLTKFTCSPRAFNFGIIGSSELIAPPKMQMEFTPLTLGVSLAVELEVSIS